MPAFFRMSEISLALGLLCFSTLAAAEEPPKPPGAKTVAFVETVHGESISDPYRWMEGQDEEYQAWLKAQGTSARAFLDKLPYRAELQKANLERGGAQASLGQVQSKGGRLFLPRRTSGSEFTRLYVRDKEGAPERLLLDPASLDTPDAKGNAINYWEASPDGKYVYFGASAAGSELAILRVIDVDSGKVIAGEVPLALFNYNSIGISTGVYPQWLPDGSGFFYNRLDDGAKPGSQEMFFNTRLYLHRLGTNFDDDLLVMNAGHDSNVAVGPVELPLVIVQPGSDQAVLMLANGVARAMRLYAAPLDAVTAGKAKWLPVASVEDNVEGFALSGTDIYLLRKDQPRGRIVKTSALKPSLASADEVVAQSDAVINTVAAAKDGIYVVSRGTTGISVRTIALDGKLRSATLPFSGTSYGRFATTASDGLFMQLENAVTPRLMVHVKGTQAIDTGLAPKAAFSTADYVSEAVEMTARDGTKVPVEIFYKKGTPRDGKRPALVNAYGAYGIDNDVPFSPFFTTFLDQGAVVGIAHVRGGGELGNEWRLAGKEATKPNTWRDAIDSAEYLINAGWTSKGRIALYGASAGGIMAGGAANERPDLWSSVIIQVGVMNTTRFEFAPNGATNIPEYGTVATPEGFKALRAMDAYQNIKSGVAYPPMLLTAGLSDPRVASWQPAKYVARMQTASTGGPVIFMVNTDQGHGIGSSQSQAAEEFSDIGAFALWASTLAE